jgi:hypothetical protein
MLKHDGGSRYVDLGEHQMDGVLSKKALEEIPSPVTWNPERFYM